MEMWPHQYYALDETIRSIEQGQTRICLTSPTGMGKSRMVCEIIDHVVSKWGWNAVLYSNRKLLVDQLAVVLKKHGIEFGVRASGWSQKNADYPVQISSIPTERVRTLEKEQWFLHGTGKKCLAVVDEAHLNNGDTAKRLFSIHQEQGHVLLGVTATPLDIGDTYKHLIQAGTTSQGRACGALLPAIHYGCDEPDMKLIGKVPLGQDLTEKENVKAIMVHGVFGRVLEWFQKLNPEHKPTILFAPGVKESIWFAEQFCKEGIAAAHIDGQEVWVDGQFYRSDKKAREEVISGSKNGDIKILCNRFVLREGIDCTWLAHGIFATIFGSLQSYLQSGGRLLRNHPGMSSVTIQDHGGNWHRHGSLNADRIWELDQTASIVAGLRADRMRNKEEREPARCPQCGLVLTGTSCKPTWGGCGWEMPSGWKKSRPVIQANGELKQMAGDIYKPRKISKAENGPDLWKKMYYRARSKKWNATFQQAFAMFAMENNWAYPDPSWPFMPKDKMDQFRKVADVPKERLT